jgi:hypothetical protein
VIHLLRGRRIVLNKKTGNQKYWLPIGRILLDDVRADSVHAIGAIDKIHRRHHVISNHETGEEAVGKILNAYSPNLIALVVSNEIPCAHGDHIPKYIGVHDRAVRSRAAVRAISCNQDSLP